MFKHTGIHLDTDASAAEIHVHSKMPSCCSFSNSHQNELVMSK
jgi:hypothetical protein